MRKRHALLLPFFCLGIVALAGGCESNVEACKAYVQKVNTERQACGEEELLDENEQCPAYLDEGDTSCIEYYTCLGENSVCTDGAAGKEMVYAVSSCAGCI